MLKKLALALLLTASLLALPGEAHAAPGTTLAGTTTRISVATGGAQANERSGNPIISSDGRYVAFTSAASNLVDSDNLSICDVDGDGDYTDNCFDAFVHDRQTGLVERVSVDGSGNEANDWSYATGISADGRFVAFTSYASNLVPGDTNGYADVFVKDRQTGTTERVSVDAIGNQSPDRDSYGGTLSADGRFVGFTSRAYNLVAGDTNGDADAFVKDRQTGGVERMSVDSSGGQANDGGFFSDMSTNARYVVFESRSTDLVPNDIGIYTDVFFHDRVTGETSRISVTSEGAQGNGESDTSRVTDDGRYVFFHSAAANLTGNPNAPASVFRHDRLTGETTVVSLNSDGVPTGGQSGNTFWINGMTFGLYSIGLDISPDGRYVAFQADGYDLVQSDTNGYPDAFVRDLQAGKTVRASLGNLGEEGNSFGYTPVLGGGGRYVAFTSTSSNLVADDTNVCQGPPGLDLASCPDIFLRDLGDDDSDENWDPFDNCPTIPNPAQDDADTDRVGDVCDNCPSTPNLAQTDSDGDGEGNACDADDDNDGLVDLQDNCPTVSNLLQEDLDMDGDGDACDNCPIDPNPDQADADSDSIGDICDIDPDGDGLEGSADPCPTVNDCDDDGLSDGADNCILVWNPGQPDEDGDLAGDECDSPGTGNVDCSGFPGVSAVDALKLLRYVAGLSVLQNEPCLDIGQQRQLAPPADVKMGDVDCSGVANAVDALMILRSVAGLSVAKPLGCPEVRLP